MTALTLATFAFAAILLVKGIVMILWGHKVGPATLKLLDNRPAAIVLWLIAVAWTLIEVAKLGPSDFGEFKPLLFAVFGFLGIASIWMLRDYLIVRAFCVITLYFVWWLLKAADYQPYITRTALVFALYVAIVKALYFTVAPWRARDGLNWTFAKPAHYQAVGAFFATYGAALALIGATYNFFKA